ncbi:hypothetical protein ABIB58_002731 [Brevundimonas sp. UYEF29]|uniref:Uncharacterized protein n=1 Tax=Sphingomonas jejuensis TaxID=904715 RepID=A0ABX0XMD2_9SPHN|nr:MULTISPECIES: hypothetical protein [Alphaproteobacteria]MCW0047098.1 hypothetical protein [Brevundimonas sp. BT-123]NJC34395.1 hypothetical protein [Sphingomonas jejuensis]
MTNSHDADGGYSTRKVEGGFDLEFNGKVVMHLRGEDGSLTAQAPTGLASSDDDKQRCFDNCFANSDQTAGAAKACAKKCGLE